MSAKEAIKLDPYIDEVLAESIIKLASDAGKASEEGIKRLSDLGIDVTDLEEELKKAKGLEKTTKRELKKAP